MRHAFSMIELIFVIVILGVLAAVAIPKLSATRDDALVASRSHAIATAASEIASFAVSQGTIDYHIENMSNMVESLVLKGEADVDSDVPDVAFRMGEVEDCLVFQIDDGEWDANLSLHYGRGGGSTSTDGMCDTLRNIFDASKFPIPLRGERVKH